MSNGHIPIHREKFLFSFAMRAKKNVNSGEGRGLEDLGWRAGDASMENINRINSWSVLGDKGRVFSSYHPSPLPPLKKHQSGTFNNWGPASLP